MLAQRQRSSTGEAGPLEREVGRRVLPPMKSGNPARRWVANAPIVSSKKHWAEEFPVSLLRVQLPMLANDLAGLGVNLIQRERPHRVAV
jgi:hypothetical protein